MAADNKVHTEKQIQTDTLQTPGNFLAGAAAVKMIIGLISSALSGWSRSLVTAGSSSDVEKVQRRPWEVTAKPFVFSVFVSRAHLGFKTEPIKV